MVLLANTVLLFVFRILGKKNQPPIVFYKKAVLENFKKIIEKQVCWCLFSIKLIFINNVINETFFNKVAGWGLQQY